MNAPAPRLERLETDRLILRRQQRQDAEVFHRLWTERDPRVPLHRRIDANGYPNTADIEAHIVKDSNTSGPALLTVVLKSNPEAIGYCGLVANSHGASGEPELAFELLQGFQRQGFATEAAQAVINWVDQVQYLRLWASVWDWNVASCRVLEKLGFTDTGRIMGKSDHGVSLLTVRERDASLLH